MLRLQILACPLLLPFFFKRVVRREIDYIRKLGVKLITSFVVGKTKPLDRLRDEFDAVFVGTGVGLPWFMNIPGENLSKTHR